MECVARQVPASGTTQAKPPGTALPDGPKQPEPSSDLLNMMVCCVVVDGSPPLVWARNEHHENVRGSTAVPPLGPPHPTVATAETEVES